MHAVGVILAFLLALVIRLGLVASQAIDAPPKFSAQPDQIDYEQLAWSMSTGVGYATQPGHPTARRPPGTSLTLLPVYLVFGHSYAAGRIWFCLLSALTCVCAAWLAGQCFNPDVGVATAFWLALYPGHFYYPLHFVSEVPYALWLTLACALTMRAIRGATHTTRFALLAGAIWALAVLTRPQVALIVPMALALAVVCRVDRKTMLTLASLLLACGLAIAPWVLRNAIVIGAPTLSTVGGATFWGANNPRVLNDPNLRGLWIQPTDLPSDTYPLDGNELQNEHTAWMYGRQFLVQHWRSVPLLEATKLWRLVSPFEPTDNAAAFWAFALGWLATAPWAMAGLVFVLRERGLAAAVLLLPLLATVATATVFYGSIRFRDSVVPLIVVLAARALVEAAAPLRRVAAVGSTGTRFGLPVHH